MTGTSRPFEVADKCERRILTFTCIVCMKEINACRGDFTNVTTADYDYDLTSAVMGRCSEARFVTKVARSHYEQKHPSEPIWNFLPRIQHHDKEGDPLDVVIYEAMRISRFGVLIPSALSRAQFTAAFQDRMQRAISWLRWSPNVFKTSKTLGIDREFRNTAIKRLQEISVASVNRIDSAEFEVAMVQYNFPQLFNKLQLFFCMKGRYRTCSVFTYRRPPTISPVCLSKTYVNERLIYAKCLLQLHANANESQASVEDKNVNANESRASAKDENANET